MIIWQKLQIFFVLSHIITCSATNDQFLISAGSSNSELKRNSINERPDLVLEFMEENGIKIWHLILALIGIIVIGFLLCYPCIHFLKLHRQNHSQHLSEPLLSGKKLEESFEVRIEGPEINQNNQIKIDLPMFRHAFCRPSTIAGRIASV
ncbi:unnamed protein product [Blepharisma stoltei]|uniref:Uncharacterized protein n=1 Tax=Blepharisma stoltei TaxID=1481888 RepID=A0AAU9IXJ5_9CILI|nr:unnamed protein product [Blepharisma stoltei]